jgi:hypothetical protein
MRTIEWGLLKEVIEHYKVYEAKTLITWNLLHHKPGVFKCRPFLTIRSIRIFKILKFTTCMGVKVTEILKILVAAFNTKWPPYVPFVDITVT